jgi:hypothetical protein
MEGPAFRSGGNTVTAVSVRRMPADQLIIRRLIKAGEKARQAHQERNRAIRDAFHDHGLSAREIARLVGMSHPGVLRVVRLAPDHDQTLVEEA